MDAPGLGAAHSNRGRGPPPPLDQVADKRFLVPAQRQLVAQRLRQATHGSNTVRVYRYGIDDLRLLKALTGAGLVGRVVVSDFVGGADVVLATRNKRLGGTADLAAARRAAANAGVPFVVLRAVSALRVSEALQPWTRAAPPERLRVREANAGRELRREDVEVDGGDTLVWLLWQAEAKAQGASRTAATPPVRRVSGGAAGPWADPLAQLAAAACATQGATAACEGDAASGDAVAAVLAARGADLADPFAWLAPSRVDVADAREGMEPRNPTARVGWMYRLTRPIKHGSRLKRKRLRKILWETNAPW